MVLVPATGFRNRQGVGGSGEIGRRRGGDQHRRWLTGGAARVVVLPLVREW